MILLLTLLALSLILVPLSIRLGVGMVVGFLLVGLIAGPSGMSWIVDTHSVMEISELGVVFLLFLIGLELEPKNLWKLRKQLFGLGSAQMFLVSLALFGVAVLFGLQWKAALVAGIGLSLSSTAIALQLLEEKELRQTPAGHAGFAVLLFQDIAVIPLMALLAIFKTSSADGGAEQAIPIWQSLAALLGLIVGGLTLSRPIFRLVARAKLREVFLIASLFIVLGAAALMHAVGLSMALGTFVAGVILANSEYRFELEAAIEPFKGLFMGLFFASVGMGLDLHLFTERPVFWIALTWVLMTAKVGIHWGLARIFGLKGFDRGAFSFSIAQIGEFAFVFFMVAVSYGILDPVTSQALTLVAILSMLFSTPAFQFFESVFCYFSDTHKKKPFDPIPENSDHVIIAGYGRMGGVIGRMLVARKVKITALDLDPNQVELVTRFGFKGFYGNAARLDLMRAAGAARAKILVVAMDDMDDAVKLVDLVKMHFPKLKMVVRCRNRQDYYVFRKRGVQHVVRETFAGSLQMSEMVLEQLGHSKQESHEMVERFKKHDESLLEEMLPHAENESRLIARSQQARQQLAALMESDQGSPKLESQVGTTPT